VSRKAGPLVELKYSSLTSGRDKTKRDNLKAYLYRIQNRKCALCLVPIKDISLSELDHDHYSGDIRQLLCHVCNKGLGMFGDNPYLLRLAAEYLEKHATPESRRKRRAARRGLSSGLRAKLLEEEINSLISK